MAYEINWKPVKLQRKPRSLLPSSQAKNATKSPYMLVLLSLSEAYNVSIRGYTVSGPGPASIPITINKGKMMVIVVYDTTHSNSYFHKVHILS